MNRRYGQKKNRGKAFFIVSGLILFAVLSLYVISLIIFDKISEAVNTREHEFPVYAIADDVTSYQSAMAVNAASSAKVNWHWYDTEGAEKVSVKTDDGLTLRGAVYKQPDKKTNKWAIVVHGYSSNKEAMRGFAQKYFESGMNVLTPDLRAHGESEGEYRGMGWLDRGDMLLWIKHVIGRDKNAEIILHGVSMGADAVMMAAGEELPKNVKAIVEDGGYTSVWDILEYHLRESYNAPVFPLMHGANFWSKGKWGFDWKEASAIDQVKKSSTPILFIHGGNDSFVPTSMAYELYQAASCDKRLLIIEGAAHGSSVISDPDRYWDTVFDFLNLYIKW